MRTDIDQVSGRRVEPAACSTPQAGRLFAQHHAEPAIAQADRASEPGETTTDNHDICFHADTRTKCTTHERLAPAARSADGPGKTRPATQQSQTFVSAAPNCGRSPCRRLMTSSSRKLR